MASSQIVERVEVHRRVFTNRRVRAAAGLDADDAVGRERPASHQKLHVLSREDVVGDHAETVVVAHALAQGVDERGFPGADRTANSEPHRSRVAS